MLIDWFHQEFGQRAGKEKLRYENWSIVQDCKWVCFDLIHWENNEPHIANIQTTMGIGQKERECLTCGAKVPKHAVLFLKIIREE